MNATVSYDPNLRYTHHTMEQIREMVWDILYLKEAGFTYDEIDGVLPLPRKSKYIMNGTRAKFLLACAG